MTLDAMTFLFVIKDAANGCLQKFIRTSFSNGVFQHDESRAKKIKLLFKTSRAI